MGKFYEKLGARAKESFAEYNRNTYESYKNLQKMSDEDAGRLYAKQAGKAVAKGLAIGTTLVVGTIAIGKGIRNYKETGNPFKKGEYSREKFFELKKENEELKKRKAESNYSKEAYEAVVKAKELMEAAAGKDEKKSEDKKAEKKDDNKKEDK